MKEVPFDQLQVGVVYCDIDREDSPLATFLRLVKKTSTRAYFEFVCGLSGYHFIDGLARFTDAAGSFYLPTRDQSEFAK